MDTNITNPPNGEDAQAVDDTKVLDTAQEGAGELTKVEGDSDFNYTPPKINLGEEGEGEKEKEIVADTPPTPPVPEKETVYVRISKEFDDLDETGKKALNYAIKNGAKTMTDFAAKIQEFAQMSAEIPVADVLTLVADENKAVSLIAEDLRIKNPNWSAERIEKSAKKEYYRIEFENDEDDRKFFYQDLANSINQNRAKGLEGIDANIFGEFKAQQEQETVPDLPYESFQAEYLPKLGGGAIELPELVVKREDGSELVNFSKNVVSAIETGANNMLASYLYNATVWNGTEWVLPETFSEKIDGEIKQLNTKEWVERRRQECLEVITFLEKGRRFDAEIARIEKLVIEAAKKERDEAVERVKKDDMKRYTGLDKTLINEGGGEVKPLIQRPVWKEKTQT